MSINKSNDGRINNDSREKEHPNHNDKRKILNEFIIQKFSILLESSSKELT
jgi:hypothetical protein